MKQKHKEMSKMAWLVMDIKDMKFDHHSFDVVIEKGTLDALLVGEKDQWNFSSEAEAFMKCVSCQVGYVMLFIIIIVLLLESMQFGDTHMNGIQVCVPKELVLKDM